MRFLAPALALAVGAVLMLAPVPASAGLIGEALTIVAAAWHPKLGVLASFATLPLYVLARPLGPVSLSVNEAILLGAAAGTGLRLARAVAHFQRHGERDRTRSPWNRLEMSASQSPYAIPLLLFLLAALVSLLVTHYPRLSLRELRLVILEPILGYLLVAHLFPTSGAVRLPLGAFLGGATVLAGGGVVASLTGLGVSQTEGVLRLQTVYQSGNNLALYLERALPFLLSLALAPGARRLPLMMAASIIALALALTFSLGGWVASGVGVCIVAWHTPEARRRRLVLALGGISVVAILILFSFRMERVASHFASGGGTGFIRLNLWQSSLQMLADHPVLGVGLDNFLYLYQQRYILPAAMSEPNLSHPHNWVLNFWLSLGLLGLSAFVWLVWSAFEQVVRLYRNEPTSRPLALGAGASLVAMLVHGSVDNSYFLPDLAQVFWLTLALVEAGRLTTTHAGRVTIDHGR